MHRKIYLNFDCRYQLDLEFQSRNAFNYHQRQYEITLCYFFCLYFTLFIYYYFIYLENCRFVNCYPRLLESHEYYLLGFGSGLILTIFYKKCFLFGLFGGLQSQFIIFSQKITLRLLSAHFLCLGSGIRVLKPDPDPGKITRIDLIRIRNPNHWSPVPNIMHFSYHVK